MGLLGDRMKGWVIVPYFRRSEEEDYRQGIDLKTAIRIRHEDLGIPLWSKPVLIIWTASGRRGVQVPDGIAQLDFTSVPSCVASMMQNVGRSGGYKQNSLFVCTDTLRFRLQKEMENPNKSSLPPSYNADKFKLGIGDQLDIKLRMFEKRRDCVRLRQIFRRIEHEILNVESHQGKKKGLNGGQTFWNHNPESPELISHDGYEGIVTEEDMDWLEENFRIFRPRHETDVHGSISLMRDCDWAYDQEGEKNSRPVGSYYELHSDKTGSHSYNLLFGLRKGQEVNTNTIWPGYCRPQVHYTYDEQKRKLKCVRLVLRIESQDIKPAVYPHKDSIMYNLLSDKEQARIDRIRDGRRSK